VLDASSLEDGRNRARLTVQRHWETAREVPIEGGGGGHGGGDALMLSDVFRGASADRLGRQAGYRDGLASVAVGLAANVSMATGQRVRVAELELPRLGTNTVAAP
jgi:hypothetical protein